LRGGFKIPRAASSGAASPEDALRGFEKRASPSRRPAILAEPTRES
jgi:hypothetical protein